MNTKLPKYWKQQLAKSMRNCTDFPFVPSMIGDDVRALSSNDYAVSVNAFPSNNPVDIRRVYARIFSPSNRRFYGQAYEDFSVAQVVSDSDLCDREVFTITRGQATCT